MAKKQRIIKHKLNKARTKFWEGVLANKKKSDTSCRGFQSFSYCRNECPYGKHGRCEITNLFGGGLLDRTNRIAMEEIANKFLASGMAKLLTYDDHHRMTRKRTLFWKGVLENWTSEGECRGSVGAVGVSSVFYCKKGCPYRVKGECVILDTFPTVIGDKTSISQMDHLAHMLLGTLEADTRKKNLKLINQRKKDEETKVASVEKGVNDELVAKYPGRANFIKAVEEGYAFIVVGSVTDKTELITIAESMGARASKAFDGDYLQNILFFKNATTGNYVYMDTLGRGYPAYIPEKDRIIGSVEGTENDKPEPGYVEPKDTGVVARKSDDPPKDPQDQGTNPDMKDFVFIHKEEYFRLINIESRLDRALKILKGSS